MPEAGERHGAPRLPRQQLNPRVNLTRLPCRRAMTAICAIETFEPRLESTEAVRNHGECLRLAEQNEILRDFFASERSEGSKKRTEEALVNTLRSFHTAWTFSGRTGPRPWTLQLGGYLPYRGCHKGQEIRPKMTFELRQDSAVAWASAPHHALL
jgi:hypothetical protein